jgi:hypothetical protein
MDRKMLGTLTSCWALVLLCAWCLLPTSAKLQDSEEFSIWFTDASTRFSASIQEDNVAFFWTIDEVAEVITLAVAAQAQSWVSFGLAEAGGLLGADIVIYEAAEGTLTDAHAVSYQAIPDCTQNWELVSASAKNGIIIFEALRKLKTGDPQDRAISTDAMVPDRIILAWGDGDVLENYGQNQIGQAVHLIESKDLDVPVEAMKGVISVSAQSYSLGAATRTWVEQKCTTWEGLTGQMEIPEEGAHAYKIEYLLDEAMAGVNYQAILVAFRNTECGITYFDAGDPVGAWAPGGMELVFPKEAGLRVGGVSGYRSFALRTYYSNPEGLRDLVDNSEFLMHVVNELRANDIGVLLSGDPIMNLAGSQVPSGITRWDFSCPSTCTQYGFQADEVTLFAQALRMQSTGVRMEAHIVREGSNVHTASVEFFDATQQGTFMVPLDEPLAIRRGDSFDVQCWYATLRDSDTNMGWGPNDEMCISFMWYYPKQAGIASGVCVPGICGAEVDGNSCLLNDIDNYSEDYYCAGSLDRVTQLDASADIRPGFERLCEDYVESQQQQYVDSSSGASLRNPVLLSTLLGLGCLLLTFNVLTK